MDNIIDAYLTTFILKDVEDIENERIKAMNWAAINGYLDYHLEVEINVLNFDKKECSYRLIVRDLSH